MFFFSYRHTDSDKILNTAQHSVVKYNVLLTRQGEFKLYVVGHYIPQNTRLNGLMFFFQFCNQETGADGWFRVYCRVDRHHRSGYAGAARGGISTIETEESDYIVYFVCVGGIEKVGRMPPKRVCAFYTRLKL